MEDILQNQKRHSTRELNRFLKRSGDFWQKHSYDHIVRDATELRAFQRYIAENPTKAGLKAGESLHRPVEWQD